MEQPYTAPKGGQANARSVNLCKALILPLLLLFLLASIVEAQTGGVYTLTRWTANGGSGTSSGGGYAVHGTAGQPEAGILSGGTLTLQGGFWHGAQTQPPCTPISEAHLSRTPTGDVFAGNTVRFTAHANGTTPFTYTWTLDGAPVGGSHSAFEHTFSATGTFTVGVTVANACGQGSDTMVVDVQPLTPGQPELTALKLVNLANVEIGDTLTYTLILRNNAAVTATTTLTDPIPAHTVYIPGSAQASGSITPTVLGAELHWAGQIISGTPVVIQFAAQIPPTETMAVDTVITNVMYLNDGLGHVTLADAHSTYNPGYRLTINDGALYTNVPTVTLRYAWNTGDDISYVRFSNDGGFGAGGNTTDWIPIDPADPTHEGWVLATYGNLVLPRTVYAMFRDASGRQHGPIHDEIIYDPNPPQVIAVEIVVGEVHSADLAGEKPISVRVTASDDNSGVVRVQVSHDVGFAQFSEFAVTGNTTDVPWMMQPSGQVHVRAIDRAGNFSQISSASTQFYSIYLPIVVNK